MIPHVEPFALTSSDRRWLKYWDRRTAENFAEISPGLPASTRGRCLAMIRYASPAAYRAIIEAEPAEPVRIIREPDSGATREVSSS